MAERLGDLYKFIKENKANNVRKRHRLDSARKTVRTFAHEIKFCRVE
jgi:hypothetical protein